MKKCPVSVLGPFAYAVYFALILSLAVLSGCAEKNAGSAQGASLAELEYSFSGQLEEVDLSYLESVVGSGSGDSETFGEKKDMLLFFWEKDCGTCEKVRPALEKWVSLSHCRIYSYNDSSAQGSDERREAMLRKLGSSDGHELTAARLLAFVDGKLRASAAGAYDLETSEKVASFASRYFSNTGENTLALESSEVYSSVTDLWSAVSSGKKFLLYLERHSCPDCRALSNPAGNNLVNSISRKFCGNFDKAVTETLLPGLKAPVSIEGKNFVSGFSYIEQTVPSEALWPETETEKKKTEYLSMLCALGLLGPAPEDAGITDFLLAVKNYLCSPGDHFAWYDRNVPSFIAVNYSLPAEKDSLIRLENTLKAAYGPLVIKSIKVDTESDFESDINFMHRIHYPRYFSCDNTKLDVNVYNTIFYSWLEQLGAELVK